MIWLPFTSLTRALLPAPMRASVSVTQGPAALASTRALAVTPFDNSACQMLPSRRAELSSVRGLMSAPRSDEHTSELQSLMRISYAVFCLKKKKADKHKPQNNKA